MRSVRNLGVLVVLWLVLGATVASAGEGQSLMAGREVSGVTRILDHLHAFLTAVWENEACDIDPFGRSSQGDAPAAPGTDEAWDIDPLG